ncbi:MAG: hypothetical protein NDF51_02195 [archaeon YNP-WB-040]|nr:hypothetical protein [Candidatus Culexarchaeum yellowstonense]
MFEDKVRKFIDEIVEMLKPLSADEVKRVYQLHDHLAAFHNYFELPAIIGSMYWERLKRLFMLGFEAQLVWMYHSKEGLVDGDKKELIETFCRVFSPHEYDQALEKIKLDIKETIDIVKGMK